MLRENHDDRSARRRALRPLDRLVDGVLEEARERLAVSAKNTFLAIGHETSFSSYALLLIRQATREYKHTICHADLSLSLGQYH